MPKQLNLKDKSIIWHPLTQEKTAPLPLAITKGKGSYLYDENNNKYLDLISSWWVNLHGHANPKIAEAIHKQALLLEQVIFAGFTHEPAVDLCSNLKNILSEQFQRFFFSDNGSTAVEVAIKMAYQYWYNTGFPGKTLFLSFEGGYHGDTFGAMSVGYSSGFYKPFEQLLFKVLNIPYPDTWDGDNSIKEKEENSLKELVKILELHSSHIAALIIEPLIQGASGMRIARPKYLKKVLDIVRSHGILIIFDEVMTGFGRTGSNFAFEQIDFIPDFLCLSKGLTGGFLPLALTVTQEYIYQAFLDDSMSKAFTHSHSYTANPLGCAAAVCSLELLLASSTQNVIKNINCAHHKGIEYLRQECDFLQHFRSLGTISAFELCSKVDNEILKKKFLEKGLILRPLGTNIYLMPPYSTTEEDLMMAYEKIASVLKEVK